MPLSEKKIAEINTCIRHVTRLTETSPDLISLRLLNKLHHFSLYPSLDKGLKNKMENTLTAGREHNAQIKTTTPPPHKTAVLFQNMPGNEVFFFQNYPNFF